MCEGMLEYRRLRKEGMNMERRNLTEEQFKQIGTRLAWEVINAKNLLKNDIVSLILPMLIYGAAYGFTQTMVLGNPIPHMIDWLPEIFAQGFIFFVPIRLCFTKHSNFFIGVFYLLAISLSWSYLNETISDFLLLGIPLFLMIRHAAYIRRMKRFLNEFIKEALKRKKEGE